MLETDELPDEAPDAQLAPMSLRLMAAVVNGSLIVGAFLAAVLVAAASVKDLPPLRGIEVGLTVALAVIARALPWAFLRLCHGYAGNALRRPLPEHLGRPEADARATVLAADGDDAVGGAHGTWRDVAIFDEDRLSWHDRLSQTYLRKR